MYDQMPAPPVSQAPPPPNPDLPPRRPWWRRGQLPFMLALVVVLPVTVGVPWWLDRQESLDSGSVPPPAPESPTGAAELAEVRWEFLGSAAGELDDSAELPEGVELVDAVFGVTPLSESGANLLSQKCEVAAQDDAGREWDATPIYDSREALENVTSSSFSGCAGPEGAPLAVDQTHTIVASYEVPEDAADSLSFVVTMDTVFHELDEEELDLADLDFEWDPDDDREPSRPVSVRLREPVL